MNNFSSYTNDMPLFFRYHPKICGFSSNLSSIKLIRRAWQTRRRSHARDYGRSIVWGQAGNEEKEEEGGVAVLEWLWRNVTSPPRAWTKLMAKYCEWLTRIGEFLTCWRSTLVSEKAFFPFLLEEIKRAKSTFHARLYHWLVNVALNIWISLGSIRIKIEIVADFHVYFYN